MAGYGMKSHVMLQFQDSFGTSQVTSMEALAVTEAGLTKGIEQIIEEGMYGRFAESPYHDGTQTFEGDIGLEANPISIGYFLKSVIGYTTTVSDSAANTHTFKPRTADFDHYAACDPMTIEQHMDVGSAFLFSDMVGNTLNVNIANGELMDMTAGFIGGNFTMKEGGTPTYPAAKPFKWDQASISFAGGAVLDLMDLTISFNNNLEARYTLQNTSVPYKIKRTAQQVIELTGTMIFQAHSYYQAFEAQSESSFKVHFASAESPNAITFDFPALRFKTFEPSVGGAGIIEASFTAGAMYSPTSATAMEITLVNTQIGYLVPSL